MDEVRAPHEVGAAGHAAKESTGEERTLPDENTAIKVAPSRGAIGPDAASSAPPPPCRACPAGAAAAAVSIEPSLPGVEDAAAELRDACMQLPRDRLLLDRIGIDKTTGAECAPGADGRLSWRRLGLARWHIWLTFTEPGQGSAGAMDISPGAIEGSAPELHQAVAEALILIEKRRDDIEKGSA